MHDCVYVINAYNRGSGEERYKKYCELTIHALPISFRLKKPGLRF